jgi:hypothetical protein
MKALNNSFTLTLPWDRTNYIGRLGPTKLIMIINNFDGNEMRLRI